MTQIWVTQLWPYTQICNLFLGLVNGLKKEAMEKNYYIFLCSPSPKSLMESMLCAPFFSLEMNGPSMWAPRISAPCKNWGETRSRKVKRFQRRTSRCFFFLAIPSLFMVRSTLDQIGNNLTNDFVLRWPLKLTLTLLTKLNNCLQLLTKGIEKKSIYVHPWNSYYNDWSFSRKTIPAPSPLSLPCSFPPLRGPSHGRMRWYTSDVDVITVGQNDVTPRRERKEREKTNFERTIKLFAWSFAKNYSMLLRTSRLRDICWSKRQFNIPTTTCMSSLM